MESALTDKIYALSAWGISMGLPATRRLNEPQQENLSLSCAAFGASPCVLSTTPPSLEEGGRMGLGQCNNRVGYSLVLTRWIVSCKCQCMGIAMTFLCLLMIRRVKNIYIFNTYLLISSLVISSFTL